MYCAKGAGTREWELDLMRWYEWDGDITSYLPGTDFNLFRPHRRFTADLIMVVFTDHRGGRHYVSSPVR